MLLLLSLWLSLLSLVWWLWPRAELQSPQVPTEPQHLRALAIVALAEYMCVCVSIYLSMYIHIYIVVYIYIYICSYMFHAQSYIYIYIYIHVAVLSCLCVFCCYLQTLANQRYRDQVFDLVGLANGIIIYRHGVLLGCGTWRTSNFWGVGVRAQHLQALAANR